MILAEVRRTSARFSLLKGEVDRPAMRGKDSGFRVPRAPNLASSGV